MAAGDEESFPGLYEALQRRFGPAAASSNAPPDTKVLEGARHINDHAIDVAIDMLGTKAAAESIWSSMQHRQYDIKTWATHELHPSAADPGTLDFIFTMDLLNFCFWSDVPGSAFTVEYRDKQWTGYWGLVAALRRAVDEGIPITSSDFWQDENECTLDLMKRVFRSSTDQEIPLIQERLDCLRQAGQILYEKYSCSFTTCIDQAEGSAAALVNLLADNFPCFHDDVKFEGRHVRFLKRAQILVADLWACYQGDGYGDFDDIDTITMFADYRIPQMLHSLGVLSFSPPLDSHLRQRLRLNEGHSWEVQLRGCSVWAVELILREIKTHHPNTGINAILIDFFLYDKKTEEVAAGVDHIPHHRTRSIWY